MRQVTYERPSDIQEPLDFESLYKLQNEHIPNTAPASTTSLNHINNIRSLKQIHSAGSTDRPESRHMNSRSDDVNKINSMAGLFHNDNNNNNDHDNGYDDDAWDEFEDSSCTVSSKILADLEKYKRNDTLNIFQYFRNFKFLEANLTSESIRKVDIVCSLPENNLLLIKATPEQQKNESEVSPITTELNLRDYGFIHYYDHDNKSMEEQISNIIDLIEFKQNASGNYEIILTKLNELAVIAKEQDISKKVQIQPQHDDKVIEPIDVTSHQINNEMHNKIEESNHHEEVVNKVPAIPLHTPYEISYDSKFEVQNDSNEKMMHVIERLVTVNFIPSVVTMNADKTASSASSRKTSSTSTSTQQSIKLMKNLTQPVTELLDAVITIECLDDMAEIEVKFKTKSNILKSSNCSAINVDQNIVTCVQLPSILFADDFLKHEYFVNLAENAKIEYMINSKPTIVL